MAICSRFVKLLRRPDGGARAGKFGRLLRDQSANVLAITAAALLPMVALTGSAIDISRMYLVKSRLQAACDSGVLAGRKAMTTLTYTTAANNRALAMFNFNFEDSDFNTTLTDFDAVADTSGKLTAEATTKLPMLVMGILGFGDYEINVDCSADIQVPNIDIVFVLDVTGSMADRINGTRKIDSLIAATIGFYDSITDAMVGNERSQVRYGFVPYSQIVNGSELFTPNPDFTDLGELPKTHIKGSQVVQSRVGNFSGPAWAVDTNVAPKIYRQIFNSSSSNTDSRSPFKDALATGTNIDSDDCDRYSANLSLRIGNGSTYNMWPLTSGGEGSGYSRVYQPVSPGTWQATTATTRPTSGNTFWRATFERVSGPSSGNTGKCERRVTHRQFKKVSGFGFINWKYMPVTYGVANFRSGNAMNYVSDIPDPDIAVASAAGFYAVAPTVAPTSLPDMLQFANQTGLTRSTTTWNGCLEERETSPNTTNFSPIPSNAWDLNYIVGGTGLSSQWRTMNPDLTWLRSNGGVESSATNNGRPGVECPSASMRNLREYDEQEFTDYVTSLQPAGNTYLDVGMVWGLRLIAPQGLFAQRNLVGPNGGQISRHIIFLTDGEPVSSPTTYSAYGTEQMEKRITGTTGVAAATLHARRFQALCDVERGRIGIWFVGLGPSVPENLRACADTGRWMQANSTTELRNAFSRIANEVADLRLVD